MSNEELYKLRFPIGTFQMPNEVTEAQIQEWITIIETLPQRLKATVKDFTEVEWNSPYRPGGWTNKQLVHHILDSHINSYIRFKWALTEDEPMIKAYEEAEWALLKDYEETPVELSLQLLDLFHQRWIFVLKNLDKGQLQRGFIHPESKKRIGLIENIGVYAWHSNHHLAHLQGFKMRQENN